MKEDELRRDPEIQPSSTVGNSTAGMQAAQHAGRRRPNVRVVWVIVASTGLLVFAAGLLAVAYPIYHDEMYFYVDGDHGPPTPSAFPAEGGYFCEQYPFMFSTCADVSVTEFDPQVPAFAKDQPFEVWLVMSDDETGCHTIAIRVEGKQYTTPVFGWLAPLEAAAPWALLLGLFGTVTATYRLAQRKAWVMVPVLALPVFVVLAYFSSHPFLGTC